MYEGIRAGPAMRRLRQRKELTAEVVAERLGLSRSAVSRIESAGSNPHTTNLLRYLDAIGCSLSQLDRELKRPDPLDVEVDHDDELLEKSAGYRELYRQLFAEVGYGGAPHQALGPVLQQLARFEARLKRLEEKENDGGEKAPG